MDECRGCGSNDVELYPAEDADERDVLHCHDCGDDYPVRRSHDSGSDQ